MVFCYAWGMSSVIVGIDEVGRGCWAGPLVAAAVVLDGDISGLDDSKKLSSTKRIQLAKEIYLQAKAVGLGWVSAELIDKIGLSAANRQAMKAALEQIVVPYDRIVIDGNYNFLHDNPQAEAVIGADGLVPEVSAASIIAKVARDSWMVNAAMEYPEYGFDRHVGYGTKLHADMIAQYGICELHRKSYKPIQKIMLSHTYGRNEL